MLMNIVRNEGIYGLYKGFSASFYSSIVAGYFYFLVYKGIKTSMKDSLQPKTAKMNAFIYALASVCAECLSMLMYYPLELIRVRFLTMNNYYQYQTVSDAFAKIVREDSIPGLYRGVITYSMAYLGQYTLQMTAFELYMDFVLRQVGAVRFKQRE